MSSTRTHTRRFGTSWINAEPTILVLGIGIGLYVAVYQDFIRWKLCTTMSPPSIANIEEYCFNGGSQTNCSATSNDHNAGGSNASSAASTITPAAGEPGGQNDAAKIQAAASIYGIYYQLCSNLPSLFTAIVMGAWSEKHGRKTPLVISLGFVALSGAGGLMVATYSWVPLEVFLAAGAVSSCAGGILVAFMASFSMVTDMAPSSSARSIRLGVASTFLSGGMLLGSLLSSVILLKTQSHKYVLMSYQLCFTLAFLYAALFVRETLQKPEKIAMAETTETSSSKFAEMRKEVWETLTGTFYILIKPREGGRQVALVLGLSVFFILFATDFGMPGLYVLYLECKLGWSDIAYGNLISLQMGAASLGMFAIPMLAKGLCCVVPDSALLLLGITVSALKMFIFSISDRDWMVYLTATMNVVSAVSYPSFRSFLSKQVDNSEIGRVFSLVAIVENVSPTVSGAIFNPIYVRSLSLKTFPGLGLSFFIGAICQLVILIPMGYIHLSENGLSCNSRRELDEDQQGFVRQGDHEQEEEENHIENPAAFTHQ